MLQTLFSFGAGVATVASPCVLPILPMLLGASLQPAGGGSAWRPVAIVGGFVLAFAAAALLFGASTHALGISAQGLRSASIALLAGFGLLLLWPGLLQWVMRPLMRPLMWSLLRPFEGLAGRAQVMGQGPGLGAAALLGISLGVVWTPCAGPVLASILALIATQQQTADAATLLLAYAAGAGLPMLAVAYGGRAASTHVRALARHAEALRRVFGVLVLATALAMQAQWDASAAAWLSQRASALWTASLPSALAATMPATKAAAPASTTAPEFTGLQTWFNSAPLSMAGLRGKVVLVDFWTFGCVNCVNTLPHLQRWHQRFADRGLVIVGIHTPEFAFERDAAQVQAAIKRHGLGYAVAQDNRYATWQAWGNQYWPALYLVDREGHVVFRHVGEGDYERIEREIEQALG